MTLPRPLRSVQVLLLVLALPIAMAPTQRATVLNGDWPSFGRDPGAQRHSPLVQINKHNVGKLQQVWSFDTGARDLQVTPLVVNGLMYLTAGSTVFALTPESGDVRWKFDAGCTSGPPRRGLLAGRPPPKAPAAVRWRRRRPDGGARLRDGSPGR